MSLSPFVGISPFSRPHFVPGGSGFVPTDIAGCTLWLPKDAAGTGLISTWPDSSGTSNNATATDEPTGVALVLNGHSVVRFNGSSNFMVCSSIPSQPYTQFIVVKVTSASTYSAFLDGKQGEGSNRNFLGTDATGAQILMYAGGGALLGYAAIPSGFNIIAATWNGSSSKAIINGSVYSVSGLGSQTANAITIGNSNIGDAPLNGDIAEVIYYNSALNDTDLNQVGNYMAAWSGISWTNI